MLLKIVKNVTNISIIVVEISKELRNPQLHFFEVVRVYPKDKFIIIFCFHLFMLWKKVCRIEMYYQEIYFCWLMQLIGDLKSTSLIHNLFTKLKLPRSSHPLTTLSCFNKKSTPFLFFCNSLAAKKCYKLLPKKI